MFGKAIEERFRVSFQLALLKLSWIQVRLGCPLYNWSKVRLAQGPIKLTVRITKLTVPLWTGL